MIKHILDIAMNRDGSSPRDKAYLDSFVDVEISLSNIEALSSKISEKRIYRLKDLDTLIKSTATKIKDVASKISRETRTTKITMSKISEYINSGTALISDNRIINVPSTTYSTSHTVDKLPKILDINGQLLQTEKLSNSVKVFLNRSESVTILEDSGLGGVISFNMNQPRRITTYKLVDNNYLLESDETVTKFYTKFIPGETIRIEIDTRTRGYAEHSFILLDNFVYADTSNTDSLYNISEIRLDSYVSEISVEYCESGNSSIFAMINDDGIWRNAKDRYVNPNGIETTGTLKLLPSHIDLRSGKLKSSYLLDLESSMISSNSWYAFSGLFQLREIKSLDMVGGFFIVKSRFLLKTYGKMVVVDGEIINGDRFIDEGLHNIIFEKGVTIPYDRNNIELISYDGNKVRYKSTSGEIDLVAPNNPAILLDLNSIEYFSDSYGMVQIDKDREITVDDIGTDELYVKYIPKGVFVNTVKVKVIFESKDSKDYVYSLGLKTV